MTAEPAARGPAPDWRAAGDCQARLRLLRAAAAGDRLQPGDDTPFAVVLAEAARTKRSGASVTPVELDLPIGLGEDQALAGKTCLIRIGAPLDLAAEQRALGRETVQSSYQSGSHAERNPAYDAAELRLRQAEQASKSRGPKIMQVGDPLLDLVGLVVGSAIASFTEASAPSEDAALTELMATPRSIDRPVYQPYHFEQTKVQAEKTATIPVALIDRATGTEWQTQLRRREARQILVLDGLDRRDRNFASQRAAGMTSDEFEDWLNAPPQLPLSDVVAGLLTAPVADGGAQLLAAAPAAAADRRSAMRPEPSQPELTLAPDPASSVRLELAGERAAGVYVEPNLVLTSSAFAPDGGLIDVIAADGDRVLGLVARRDPGLGLALIQVPRSGQPVALPSAETALADDLVRIKGPARQASLPGAPLFQGVQLAALRRDGSDGAGSFVRATAIRRFLGAADTTAPQR